MSAFTEYRSKILAQLVYVGAMFGASLSPAFAQTPMAMPMPMPMSAAPRDVTLMRAFVDAGGGPGAFQTSVFVATLTADKPERFSQVQKTYDSKTIALFERVLDFVVADSIAPVKWTSAGARRPADLGRELYRAGSVAGQPFQVERLFDVIFGHTAHMRAMANVAALFGAPGEVAYHKVLTTLIIAAGRDGRPASSAVTGMSAPPASGSPTAMDPSMHMGSMSDPPAPAVAKPASSGRASATMDSAMKMGDMKMTDGMQMGAMPTNASGVMSMYGMRDATMGKATMAMRSMPAVTDIGSPMSREGSGTAWLPDSTTAFGHMSTRGAAMLMTHGAAFVRYSGTFGERGSRTFNAPDWYMVMASHALSPASQLGARVMVTTDFALVGGYGYPELFQTGETFHGRALHDHQHPHDLFSEAALTYSARLSRSASAFAYLGYPGEPALGPPTYMHRLIAYDMPDAPLGHHWQDATHITFGVATAGVTVGNIKVEASSFTGREPNEIRTNFDRARLDSVSSRISWNPGAHLATQVSFGFVKSPETKAPAIDQHRTTASVVYHKPLGLGDFFTTSAVWGQNYESDGARSNAYLLEADYHRAFGSIYGRAEFVQKSGSELALDDSVRRTASPSLLGTAFPIGAYTLGYVHDVRSAVSGTVTGLGGQVTFNTRPGALAPFYGRQTPWGFEVFARFRPTPLR